MKLKYLLMGALVGLAFTACTNDDEPAVKGPSRSADAKDYVAVKIVMPGDATTRAWDADAFEAGSENENTVTKALFFFMKGSTQVADPYEITADNNGDMEALEGTILNPWTDGTENTIEKLSKVIVVLAKKIENPTHIIAVLNAGLSDLGLSKTSTLSDITSKVADYATTTLTAKGKFVMSSSIYDDVKTIIGAEVETVYDTVEEAKAAPSVRIPVERVVAKVSVGGTDTATQNTANEDTASTTISVLDKEGNSVDLDITAEVTGWWLDNNPSQSLLIKKLEAESAYTTVSADLKKSWYDDATNYRSYWATPSTGTLKHYAYNENGTADRYTLENTDQANPTQVVVAATLKSNNKAIDLVKYLGVLYTKEGFETALVNVLAHTYYTATTSENSTIYTSVTTNDVDFTYSEATTQYEAVITLAKKNADAVWYVKSGDSYTEADPTSDLKSYTIQYWAGGTTYYYVQIVHNDGITVGTGDDAHGLYGVIRNHWYKITVKSINGLGTPVPSKDVDEEIIPIIPEDEHSYISAEIAILKWKVVEQDVDLGK